MVFIFVWGYMAGLNGLAGHELIHKREPYNKTIGMLTYTKILYSHFFLEHGSGHHRNVATELDPATANQGETFYTFFPRSAFGGLLCTYKREVERIEAEFAEIHRQQKSVPPPSVPMLVSLCQNRVIQYSAIHCAILLAIFSLLGTKAVIFQLGYSLVGIFFIELINYVEHYGLTRRQDARGIYEPITEKHSWNSTSSHLLFRIQRHSDHHMHAYRPYQILRALDSAP